MYDNSPAFPYIADLVEQPDAREILSSLAKDLSEITRMAAKARALLNSDTLSQPDAYGIFSTLSQRMAFKDYALITLNTLISQPKLSASLEKKARALKSRTLRVHTNLEQTLAGSYLHISKRLSDIVPIYARNAVSLADLAKQLQQSSQDLLTLLQNVSIVAALEPLPVTIKEIEKARADLRHNRAETALAATQLGPFARTGNADTDALHIAAAASIASIAQTIDALELAYKAMETRLEQTGGSSATVH